VASWIAEHPQISAFRDTGVPQDEGQHLQDVFPTAAELGGPGRFAFAPASHLTEASPLATRASRERLWQAWAPHWDLGQPVLLEKSPPNLMRTRFLQAMFPDTSHFLLVVRHPIAVAYATKRWTRLATWIPPQASRRLQQLQEPLHTLVRHWVEAHECVLADATVLRNVCIVRYEDLVADPAGNLQGIFRFLNLEPVSREWEVKGGLNELYFQRWHARVQSRRGRAYLSRVARDFEDRVRPYGYSLLHPDQFAAPEPPVARYSLHGGFTSPGQP